MNTTERLAQLIDNGWDTGEISRKIADEFALIPRAEIPVSTIEGDSIVIPGSPSWRLESYTAERLYREAARYISRAEALEKHEAAAKAAELAADNAKLDAEALAFWNAAQGLTSVELPSLHTSKYRRVALAAREIHGVAK